MLGFSPVKAFGGVVVPLEPPPRPHWIAAHYPPPPGASLARLLCLHLIRLPRRLLHLLCSGRARLVQHTFRQLLQVAGHHHADQA